MPIGHDDVTTEVNTVQKLRFELDIPDWLQQFIAAVPAGTRFETPEQRMELVIELSRRNIEQGSGGPFGAAIFDIQTHQLIAPGVNLVMANQCSVLHAEVVAIMLAQRAVGSFDLGAAANVGYELYSSTEPCAMCLGATGWSGVRRLVCAARDQDARAVGFDEGVKAADWVSGFQARGIEVVRDVCREQAVAVLQTYLHSGGVIYNARQGGVIAG